MSSAFAFSASVGNGLSNGGMAFIRVSSNPLFSFPSTNNSEYLYFSPLHITDIVSYYNTISRS